MYIYWPFDNNRSTHNFGDAINPFIGEFFSGEKVTNINGIEDKITKNDKPYLVCGSSMTFVKIPTIIWGSAILTPRWKIKTNPLDVIAVRGPKTRKYLLDRNIKCPAVYGDPGLLCPMMFKAEKTKEYKIGIIPHVVDRNAVSKWKLPESMLNIDIRKDFQEVVNDVNRCEHIISSSLHGLILADAYQIPSLWVVISGIPTAKGKEFKYQDYLESIQADIYSPYKLNYDNITKVKKLMSMCRYNDIKLDLKQLVDCCPFNKLGKTWGS
jgi:pyruvyltransferase